MDIVRHFPRTPIDPPATCTAVHSRLSNAFANGYKTRFCIDLFQKSNAAARTYRIHGVDHMEQEYQHPGSRLFTVRLWQEELGGGQIEWRGRGQDITSGAAAYFRDWPGLISVLSRLVETTEAPAGDAAEQGAAGTDPLRMTT